MKAEFEKGYEFLAIPFFLLILLVVPFPLWLGWHCLRLAIPELPILTYRAAFFIMLGLELITGTVKALFKR